MRVLVVGQGGREHALVWALARSPSVDRVFAAPGNAGMEEAATCVAIDVMDRAGIVHFVMQEGIDLTVVGPEAPLVEGLVDDLARAGFRAFGPTAAAAEIEASKRWAKAICEKYGIPTPASRWFSNIDKAVAFLDELEPPYVVKANGLAGGKGVAIAESRGDAVEALRARLVDRVFGEAGATVLVEEYLEGREVSALALTDGKTVVPLVLAQDFKRIEDGDRGPNTGGMGAYSPVPFVDPETQGWVVENILENVVAAHEAEQIPYKGVLYAGLMLTDRGPQVLEFNCRFGDPEAQAVLPRLTSDLGRVLLACVDGTLGAERLEWTPKACVSVVLASPGYPGSYPTGLPISGLEEASAVEDVSVFHAGTARRNGRVVTAGGRVMAVSALGDDLAAARIRAYDACSRISFDGMHYRTDIAKEAAGD